MAAWLEATPPFTSGNDARRRIDQLFELDASEGFDEEMRLQLDDCLTTNEAAALRDRLFELRACDPAVGSGAFPMGLLHELLNLLRLCETRAKGKDPAERDPTWLYETKKHVIEYVLYGVDIQERAIEICKLRLWLSLMVDHELDVDPFNCDPRSFKNALKSLDPLPNLDFKIRCANSLMDSIHGQVINLGAHNPSDQIRPILNKLIAAKQDFYDAHTAKEKRRLRFVIYEATAELAKFELGWARTQIGLIVTNNEVDRAQKALSFVFEQIRDARGAKVAQQEKALERIQAWFDDPDKTTFVWQLDFAEVFHRHENGNLSASGKPNHSDETATAKPPRYGFDLIIGNPPYVRIQTLTKSDPEAVAYYKERYQAANKGNYDLYVVFVERGLELLDEHHGQLGYILPHKFFNAQYGEPLRTLISEGKHLRHVVHFGDQQIFPGATNYVCLLFLASAGVETCQFGRANLKTWLATTSAPEIDLPASRITASAWNYATGQGADLFEKLQNMPVKLGQIARIFQGLVTGADKVFALEAVGQTKNSLVKVRDREGVEWKLERSILRPFLQHVSLASYEQPTVAHWLLYPYSVSDGRAELLASEDLASHFPNAWMYLKKHASTLREREGGKWHHDHWYAFGRTQNLTQMDAPKLIVQVISQVGRYSYDASGIYFSGGGNGPYYGIRLLSFEVARSLRYLQALLNSHVLDFLLHKVSSPFRGGYWSYGKRFIEQLPIPDATESQQSALEYLVDCLLLLRAQHGISAPDGIYPQAPAVASFVEQGINALVYELFFAEVLHASGLRFFDLLNVASLPKWYSSPPSQAKDLQTVFDLFQKLQSPGHPVRIALDKLQTLDLIRIAEGQA